MIVFNSGSSTDVGAIRTQNQDSFAITDNAFVVADGMGGHLGGEVASALAVEAFNQAIANKEPLTAKDLSEAAKAANSAVFARAQADSTLQGMGTTITSLSIIDSEIEQGVEQRIGIAHIGDSRAYIFRDGTLQQLTNDHSLVEDLLRTGQISPEEAESHPRRNILTRALGVDQDVIAEIVQVLPLKGDRFVLCSDGLVREQTDDQIAAVLRRLADPSDAARDLVARAKEHGGADNITVIVIDVVNADTDPHKAALDAIAAPIAQNSAAVSTITSQSAPRSSSIRSAPIKSSKSRPMLTPRVVVFLFAFLLVVGATFVIVADYATHAYYVTLSGDHLVVYKGRPGGVLWVKPKLVETTPVVTSQVVPGRTAELAKGRVFNTNAEAHQYITNLTNEAAAAGVIASTTTSTIATTPQSFGTVPGATR